MLLADLRELAHGIHPPVLSDRGLVAAIRARTDRLPAAVMLHAPPELTGRRFGADVEGATYFVVCEALTNVIKHAGADAIDVEVSTPAGHLRVEIRDDGAGFDRANGGGRGVLGMRDRVEALGGRLPVESTCGSGTRVRADLPIGGECG
jgi:signal transduction histidine kinase